MVINNIHYKYVVKETGYNNNNNKDHKVRDIFLMYNQVLTTDIRRNLRISKENCFLTSKKDKDAKS